VQLADRPHSYLPLQIFAEADKASQLFQYYLLDTEGFEPNVFTKIFPGINDAVQLTATGGNCGLPVLGSVRVVLEPKPGLPTDPHHPKAFREFRERGIPSGLANEIYLDVYARPASFEPGVKNLQRRLFDAYAAEVARVDPHNGIITAPVGDADTPTDGFPNNFRLYLSPTDFNRFAVTREINDGLLAPRFAPSQRAWVLTGFRVAVTPAIPASEGRDSDDR
jgi:hypothetical protein